MSVTPLTSKEIEKSKIKPFGSRFFVPAYKMKNGRFGGFYCDTEVEAKREQLTLLKCRKEEEQAASKLNT